MEKGAAVADFEWLLELVRSDNESLIRYKEKVFCVILHMLRNNSHEVIQIKSVRTLRHCKLKMSVSFHRISSEVIDYNRYTRKLLLARNLVEIIWR